MCFYVYRILCVTSGKSYIGISKNLHHRWSTHRGELRRGVHHSSKLQRAWNKHSAAAFEYSVIDQAETLEEVKQLEIKWIVHFDSVANGYNTTRGGDYVSESVMRRVVWNGIEYESVKSAAKACGIDDASMHERLNRGYICDADMLNSRAPVQVTWNGVQYPSIEEAARQLGINGETMRERTKKGYTCDADIKPPGFGKYRAVVWNGIEYPTMTAAAKANGVCGKAMQYRIEQGYTCDKDMQVRPRK